MTAGYVLVLLLEKLLNWISRFRLFALLLGLTIAALVICILPSPKGGETYHWEKHPSFLSAQAQASNTLSSNEILSILKQINDPEFPINVVDLGLIYDIRVTAEDVALTMTLTSPKCPLAGFLIEDIKRAVFSHPCVQSLKLNLTFDPPWTIDRISPKVQEKILGISPDLGTCKEVP